MTRGEEVFRFWAGFLGIVLVSLILRDVEMTPLAVIMLYLAIAGVAANVGKKR